MKKPPEEAECDICDKRATKVLDHTTSEWCDNWFIGWYCSKCYNRVEKAMRQNMQKEQSRVKDRHQHV